MSYKISVIIPVYNTELYIANTLASVISQTFKNFEVILVNDGTLDNAILVGEQILINSGVDYKIIHQENRGQGISRNTGVNNSSGEWIFFLDSDDILHKDTFSLMIDAVKKSEKNIDMVFCDFQYVSPGNEFIYPDKYDGEIVYTKSQIQNAFLKRTEIVLVPGTLYKRSWYCQYCFRFINIPYSEDQLFMWEALLKVNKIIKVQKILYNYLIRPNSIMTSSKYHQISVGYPYFKAMQEKYLAEVGMRSLVSKHLLSRWVMGIMRSSAKLCTKEEYNDLVIRFDAFKHYKKLLSFPDVKVKFLAILCVLFPKFIYQINKKL